MISNLLTKSVFLFLFIISLTSEVYSYQKGFADIVSPLLPGVVNISIIRETDDSQSNYESVFDRLFKRFVQVEENDDEDDIIIASSVGSGFVVNDLGYIVTNDHVIADADTVVVTFHSTEGQVEKELKAKVIGRDPRTDLALLKVEYEEPLCSLKWGDSKKSRIGDWVIAIGNPFGLGSTVTAGIISSMGREIPLSMGASQYIEGFLQIDAAINKGNSGGPLLNIDGKVIGVVNAIATPTGGNIGIGFAIPSEIAQLTIDQLKEFGRPYRACLGVGILDLTKEKALYYGLNNLRGAEVSEVYANSAASRAGIEEGDVILNFDTKDIPSARYLPRVVGETPIGPSIPMVVWRDHDYVVVLLELDEYIPGKSNIVVVKKKKD